MSELDLLVRGGLALLAPPGKTAHVDLGIHEGKIAAIGHNLELKAAAILEASGLILLPGAVDATGAYAAAPEADGAAFAAGGGTLFADLSAPVFDRAELLRKKEELLARSPVDFALWAALSSRNLYELASLREAGAVGFHGALVQCADGPPPVTPAVLGRAMEKAKELGLPVLVHAEDGARIERERLALVERGERGAAAYAASRPPEAELDAVRIALELAGEAGCTLLLAHASLPESAALAAEARGRGVDVSVITAPHYLFFTGADVPARPAPPLRSPEARDGLRAALREGRIDFLGSGHRSAPGAADPAAPDLLLPEGIAGCQHAFAALWAGAMFAPESEFNLGLDPSLLAALCAGRAAERLGLGGRKGSLAVGQDADFTLLDLDEVETVDPRHLLYPRRESPYAGRTVAGRIVRTMLRGRTVFANGQVAKRGEVCFIRPES